MLAQELLHLADRFYHRCDNGAFMTVRYPKRVAEIRGLQRRICGEVFIQPHLRSLLDGVGDASIFIKDVNGVLVFGNKSLLQRLGLRNETDMLGRTDREFLPSHLTEKYRQDDQEVIRSGREKTNLIEMFKNEQGLLQWFITHKYPVLDRNGRVVGIMGSIQEYRKMNSGVSSGDPGILAAAEFIQQNFRNPVSIEKLSRLAQVPVRQFQRKFKLVFDTSPREYIMRHRLRYACEALRNTGKGIAKICAEAGFYDQSSFTRQFRKYMNVTPLKYRQGTSVALRMR